MRPFRFGVSVGAKPGADLWCEAARKAEALGYDVLLTADHIGPNHGSPLLPLAAVAQVTSTIRLGTLVLNNDFHHPLLLAREAVTLDQLSGGRLELGLGAGYGKREYDAAGMSFDGGAQRVARLEESFAILDALLSGQAVDHCGVHHQVRTEALGGEPIQRPRLPLLVAGHRPRVLSLAARHADIVGLSGLVAQDGWIGIGGLDPAHVAERVDFLRTEAGQRFEQIELNALVQRVVITDDPEREARTFAERLGGVPYEDLLDSPFVLLGSVESIAERLHGYRAELGISYFAVFEPSMDDFAAVIEHLRHA